MKSEKGFTLVETILALAILGIISAAFLGGVATTSTARVTADERASGKILAESLMENIKKQPYDSSYTVTVPDEFPGYTVNTTIENLKNGNIQMISISVTHHNRDVITLESYKANR